ncbi:MAG TPA: class II fructose-bisphosphatase [Caldilineae bacterium]|nr:class II fructose-bisphosphatase [Caldilineae bacterium]
MHEIPERNMGFGLVRVTEEAAVAAGRWMGLGNRKEADQSAVNAMLAALETIDMDGVIVIGEEGRHGGQSPFDSGNHVGNKNGPEMDVVIDPIDGTQLLIEGRPGAISVVGVAPRGSLWSPSPAIYMEKIVVDREVASALVPECLDAPAAWTLALIARVKQKEIRDLIVFILDRPRHADLIAEIRMAGARVALNDEGDIAGAILAATPGNNVDVLMGIGGVAEGVTAACAVKALGGAMLVRIAPQSKQEHEKIMQAGLDLNRVLTCDDLVQSDEIFFAATGITDGPLLDGVLYHSGRAWTHSLVIRAETGIRREIRAERLVEG